MSSTAAPDSALRRGLRRPRTVIGLCIVGVCVLLGLLAPVLSRHSPLDQSFGALQSLSLAHPLGTDELGRDLLARVLYGIRVDVVVALSAIPLGALVGCSLGMLSANNRWYGTLLQRSFDLMLAFTALIMGMLIAALIGSGTPAVILTVALVNVPLFGRIVRTATTQQDALATLLTATLAEDWPMERLDPVLRALLRAAAAELWMSDGPPGRVVINEYLDIAHGFFDGDIPNMANGVLDRLARRLRPGEFPGELPGESAS